MLRGTTKNGSPQQLGGDMKVLMQTTLVGEGVYLPAGEIVEVPAAFGRALCSEPQEMPRATPVAETRAKRSEKPQPAAVRQVETRE